MESITSRIGFLALVVALYGASAASAAPIIPSPATDLALTGTGFSETDLDAGHTGAKLVDGERDGRFGDPNSVAHSDQGSVNPYMGVRWATAQSLASIIIFNRTDDGSTRIDVGHTSPFTVDIVSGASSVYTNSSGGSAGPGTAFSYTSNYHGGTVVFTGDYTFTPDITLGLGAASGMTITLPSLTSANEIVVIQHVTDGSGNLYMNLAEIEAYAPVPEPASCLLLGLGSAGCLVRRRRLSTSLKSA